jgi:hypothetical protein
MEVGSGLGAVSSGNPARALLQDAVEAGSIVNGQIQLIAGRITFGETGTSGYWDDNTGTGQMSLIAGAGPFVPGETWHSISLGTGVTGTIRVKLLPWNAVFLHVQVTNTVTGAVNLGSLPSASYYPTAALNLPLASGNGFSYLHIPTSGALQINNSTTGSPGFAGMYPNN